MAMMQGKQQQTAIPIRLATATQMTTKMTSKARNATQSLQVYKKQRFDRRNHDKWKKDQELLFSDYIPVELRRRLRECFGITSDPVKPHDPPDEREHRIRRLEVLGETGIVNKYEDL